MEMDPAVESSALTAEELMQRRLQRHAERLIRIQNRSPRCKAIRKLTHYRQEQTRTRLNDLRKDEDITLSNINRSQIANNTYVHAFIVTTTKDSDQYSVRIETKISKSTSMWFEVPEFCSGVTDESIHAVYDTCEDSMVPSGHIKQSHKRDGVVIHLDLRIRSPWHIQDFSEVLGAVCGDFIANDRVYNLLDYQFTMFLKDRLVADGRYTVSMPQSRLIMPSL